MVMGGRKVGRFGVRIGVRMFSIEDRRRAVDLYFTEGMTIRKVVVFRQVGVSCLVMYFGLSLFGVGGSVRW